GEEDSTGTPARVGIIGAGSLGAQLAREMGMRRNSERKVIAFFDDDCTKWQKRIHEIPVVGMPECLLEGWKPKLDEVIIALPSASEKRMRQIDQVLRQAQLKSQVVFWLAQSRRNGQAANGAASDLSIFEAGTPASSPSP